MWNGWGYSSRHSLAAAALENQQQPSNRTMNGSIAQQQQQEQQQQTAAVVNSRIGRAAMLCGNRNIPGAYHHQQRQMQL
jgi:hypothetical protein